MVTSSRERVLTALQCRQPDRVPYCEFGIDRALANALMGWYTAGPHNQAANLEANPFSVDEAKALAARLDGQVLTFKARAGEGDRLYGSITGHDIAEALQRATGTEVDRRYLEIEHPIKSLGEHDVLLRLGAGATATLKVRVERSTEE